MELNIKHTLLISIFLLSMNAFCQSEYESGYCCNIKDKDYIEVSNESDLPKFIKLKIDSIVQNHFNNYRSYIEFTCAYKYGNTDTNKFEKIDVYYVYTPTTMSSSIIGKYCVLFSFSQNGNLLKNINLPSSNWQADSILSEVEAFQLTNNLWKNDKWDINARLVLEKKQKCFVWILTRQIERPSRKGRYGRNQSIYINAHNSSIIDNKKYYCNTL